MALIINTNLWSLNAQRHLSRTSQTLAGTYARLASGLRINTARDDAAGLTISTRMTAQIRGLNQAQRNANDAISLAQVADSALDETTTALQRMRELAVQASNDTYTSADRATIQKEVKQLVAEVQRIATQTQFNSMNLLTGSFDRKNFQVGAFAGQTITMAIGSTSSAALGVSGATALDVSTYGAQSTAIAQLDHALASVSDIRATLGAMQNRFSSVIANLANMSENVVAAQSRIVDADVAEESAKLTRNTILQQVAAAVLVQANQQPQLAMRLLGFAG